VSEKIIREKGEALKGEREYHHREIFYSYF
jgi:hypothetical protein